MTNYFIYYDEFIVNNFPAMSPQQPDRMLEDMTGNSAPGAGANNVLPEVRRSFAGSARQFTRSSPTIAEKIGLECLALGRLTPPYIEWLEGRRPKGRGSDSDFLDWRKANAFFKTFKVDPRNIPPSDDTPVIIPWPWLPARGIVLYRGEAWVRCLPRRVDWFEGFENVRVLGPGRIALGYLDANIEVDLTTGEARLIEA